MKGGVTIYLDFSRYSDEVASIIAQRTSAQIVRLARQKVRKKTGELRNSIKNIGVSKFRFLAVADTPYAAAQEWGRPDLPKYGFTPYMEPSAAETVEPNTFKGIVREAELAAVIRAAKRG